MDKRPDHPQQAILLCWLRGGLPSAGPIPEPLPSQPHRCSPEIYRDRPRRSTIPPPGMQTAQEGRHFLATSSPQSRISPIVQKLIPDFPKPNIPGIVNNLNTSQGQTYNLHKIDTKIDYQATQKLRISGRYGYQPYNSLTQPLYGPILGGASDGWAAFPRRRRETTSSTARRSQFRRQRHTY